MADSDFAPEREPQLESPANSEPPPVDAPEPPPVAPAFPPPAGPPEPLTFPPAPVAAPASGLRPFAVLIGIGVAMVLAIGAALFLTLGGNDLEAAENRVLSYYKELSDKDGKAAKKLLKKVDGAVNDSEYGYSTDLFDSPFWKSESLSTGYTAPSEVEVVRSVPGAAPGVDKKSKREYALVTVAYTVGGKPTTESFTLERDRKGTWSIVTAELGIISFGESSFDYRIAGYTPDEEEYYEALLLPPGSYDMSLKDNEIFEDERAELVVAPGLGDALGTEFPLETLDLKVRDDIVAEVEEQVKEVIDICATADLSESFDYDCDWETEDGESIPPLSVDEWDVKSYPEIKITVDRFGNAEVETVKPGKAEGEDMFDEEKITALIEPSGTITVEDGEVSWGED